MTTDRYLTRGGVAVGRTIEDVPVRNAIEPIVTALDERRGALLASSYEYPGRYTRWDLGFVDPPVALTARGRRFRADALNARGRVLLPAIASVLSTLDAVATLETRDDGLDGEVRVATGRFPEEERSRQPSIFALLRALEPEADRLELEGEVVAESAVEAQVRLSLVEEEVDERPEQGEDRR